MCLPHSSAAAGAVDSFVRLSLHLLSFPPHKEPPSLPVGQFPIYGKYTQPLKDTLTVCGIWYRSTTYLLAFQNIPFCFLPYFGFAKKSFFLCRSSITYFLSYFYPTQVLSCLVTICRKWSFVCLFFSGLTELQPIRLGFFIKVKIFNCPF